MRIYINLSRSWTVFNNFSSYSYQRFQIPLESLCFSPWFPIHFCNPFLRVSASHLFCYNPLSKQEINVWRENVGRGKCFIILKLNLSLLVCVLGLEKSKHLCDDVCLSLSYCLYPYQTTSLTVYSETLIFALFFLSFFSLEHILLEKFKPLGLVHCGSQTCLLRKLRKTWSL